MIEDINFKLFAAYLNRYNLEGVKLNFKLIYLILFRRQFYFIPILIVLHNKDGPIYSRLTYKIRMIVYGFNVDYCRVAYFYVKRSSSYLILLATVCIYLWFTENSTQHTTKIYPGYQIHVIYRFHIYWTLLVVKLKLAVVNEKAVHINFIHDGCIVEGFKLLFESPVLRSHMHKTIGPHFSKYYVRKTLLSIPVVRLKNGLPAPLQIDAHKYGLLFVIFMAQVG